MSTIVCQRQLSIKIKPASLDFSLLSWSNVIVKIGNAFTPDAAVVITGFNLNSNMTGGWPSPPGDPFGGARIDMTGSLPYNGPAVPGCSIHFEWSHSANNTTCTYELLALDMTGLGSILLTPAPPVVCHNAGTYDGTFTMPDTLGISRTFTVRCNSELMCSNGASGSFINKSGVLFPHY